MQAENVATASSVTFALLSRLIKSQIRIALAASLPLMDSTSVSPVSVGKPGSFLLWYIGAFETLDRPSDEIFTRELPDIATVFQLQQANQKIRCGRIEL